MTYNPDLPLPKPPTKEQPAMKRPTPTQLPTVTTNGKPDIGQTRHMVVDMTAATDIKVAVRITDRRNIFGRQEFLVTPIAGEGEAWVTDKRFT